MLLYAKPGVGKTTVLRDLAEQLSGPPWSLHTVVTDGREELFFGEASPRIPGDERHALSVLPGWPKAAGMEAALRCMSPELLVCDEIGGEEADAILENGRGGLPLIARRPRRVGSRAVRQDPPFTGSLRRGSSAAASDFPEAVKVGCASTVRR